MNKKLLVVIDMQNDFITGALGNKECQAVVPAVAAKVKSDRRKCKYCIHT